MIQDFFDKETDCEKKMLTIERRRFYDIEESIRPAGYSNLYLVGFASDCIRHSDKFEDLRYLNLALKVRDSNYVNCDKADLTSALSNFLGILRTKFIS